MNMDPRARQRVIFSSVALLIALSAFVRTGGMDDMRPVHIVVLAAASAAFVVFIFNFIRMFKKKG